MQIRIGCISSNRWRCGGAKHHIQLEIFIKFAAPRYSDYRIKSVDGRNAQGSIIKIAELMAYGYEKIRHSQRF